MEKLCAGNFAVARIGAQNKSVCLIYYYVDRFVWRVMDIVTGERYWIYPEDLTKVYRCSDCNIVKGTKRVPSKWKKFVGKNELNVFGEMYICFKCQKEKP